MFCCISNSVPHEPVVSRTSGCLYERSLVEAHIGAHGTCPVTGEPLRAEDLIPVRRGALTSASPASDTIPGLLERFHAQWDAVMLEQYALRQRLAQTQQELAHALHQYEAACRVIATFIKDRDECAAAPAAALSAQGGVPDAVLERIDAQDSSQRAARRLRASPPRLSAVAALRDFAEVRRVDAGGAACAVAWAEDRSLIVGLLSGGVARVPCGGSAHSPPVAGEGAVVSAGHALAVRHIAHCGAEGAVTAGDDAALRLWAAQCGGRADGAAALVCRSVARPHSGAVAGVAAVTGGIVLSASAREVALCDMGRGEAIAAVLAADTGAPAVASLAAHPYGTIAALGGSGALCVWDVRQMCADTHVAIPSGGCVVSVAFAGDCFTLSTGLRGGEVMLWDLRKMSAPLAEVRRGKDTAAAPVVAFDAYGKYLAVAEDNVQLFDWAAAPNEPICALSGHQEAVTGVCWGTDARAVASCSLDGTVRLYGTS